MKLEICHLYPDVLNLYGDQGNIICLQKRLAWRGIESAVTELPIGARDDLTRFDLFFIGGGQDFEQGVLLSDLATGKAADIRAAVADGKVFLAVCGGYQMLGQYYLTREGGQMDFIGAVDLYTVGAETRMIGDMMFDTGQAVGGVVVGFENHSGRTYLGQGVSPLGLVLSGHGNNGEDGTEGCRSQNVFGTYAHGPVLPKNPKFADHILSAALSLRYPGVTLAELDDSLENAAHAYMAARLAK